MSHKNIEPYQISIPQRIEGERVTETIQVVVPLNYMNGSMKFILECTSWLSSDFMPQVSGPQIFTQYDQHLNTRRCDPIDACMDNAITGAIKLVLDYFCFVRRRIEIERKMPPRLDEFRKMLEADAELKKILIDCDDASV